jgi:hypothetical protein
MGGFSTDQAQRWILYSGVVTGGLAVAGAMERDKKVPNVRIIAGTFTAVVILSAVAEAEPQVAGAFAVLMLVVAIGGAGPDVLAKVTGQRPRATADIGRQPGQAPSNVTDVDRLLSSSGSAGMGPLLPSPRIPR